MRPLRLASSELMSTSKLRIGQTLFQWVRAIAGTCRRSWERRAAVARLRELDGHLLKDIGVDRSEILSLVYGKGSDFTRRFRD